MNTLLLTTAAAKMTSWDTSCGSKFDRINTETLSMTSSKGTFEAGDIVTIDTSGTCNLHNTFMGGSWSIRVYEEGFPKPVGDFHGDDLSKVMTFPDAKNTTFRISGVQFPLPTSGATNEFQISFVGRDFEKSTYFCVDIFYNLHTGVVKMMNKEAPTTMKQEEAKEVHYPVYCKANGFCHVPPQPTSCTDDAECRTPWYRSSYCQSGGTCHLELPPKCKTDSDCNPKKVSVLLMAALNKQATKKNTEAPLLGSCKTDADCPSSYCKNDPTKQAPYQCHLCGDECCEDDTDCDGSYCINDPTKMPPYFCHASSSNNLFDAILMPKMLAKTQVSDPDPFTVTTDPGNFTVSKVEMTTKTGQFESGSAATVVVTGVAEKLVTAGAVKYQVYETGVTSFIASGNSNFFQCTNKGCDSSKPIALTLKEPTTSSSEYTLEFTFVIPKDQSESKHYRLVVWAVDQDHQPYDFSATIDFDSRN